MLHADKRVQCVNKDKFYFGLDIKARKFCCATFPRANSSTQFSCNKCLLNANYEKKIYKT